MLATHLSAKVFSTPRTWLPKARWTVETTWPSLLPLSRLGGPSFPFLEVNLTSGLRLPNKGVKFKGEAYEELNSSCWSIIFLSEVWWFGLVTILERYIWTWPEFMEEEEREKTCWRLSSVSFLYNRSTSVATCTSNATEPGSSFVGRTLLGRLRYLWQQTNLGFRKTVEDL